MTSQLRLAIVAAIAGLIALDASTAAGQWIEVRRSHYSVFYQPDVARDTAMIIRWADSSIALMHSKYGVTPDRYRLGIYLYPSPAAGVTVDDARIHCCSDSAGVDTGRIELLAPSAPAMQQSTAVSSLGVRKNSESYVAKILMSEYIPIGHYEVQRQRADGGWSYYDAPNWFVQGLQEFDAIFHSTTENRSTTSRRLMAWAKAHSDVFSCCSPDLSLRDDYNGGAAVLAFLAAEFGESVHQRILADSASTFAAALTDVTRPLSRRQLFARFQTWLNAQP
ncbi:MAG TPA: hypothetical protein VGM20_02470 [Gemmatimonadales bacterium]|jgi:hypothetical protein